MLADDVCTLGLQRTNCNPQLLATIMRRIKDAHKYVLAPQFAAVADALSNDYGSLVRAFPFCRLPYSNVWFEVVHTERPGFANSTIQAPNFQMRPHRVGFLCTASRDDLSAWKTHLFWSIRDHNNISCSAAGLAIDFSMLRPLTEIDILPSEEERTLGIRSDIFNEIVPHPGWQQSQPSVKLAMLNHANPVIPDYGMPQPIGIEPDKYDEFYDLVTQLARSDWAGEVAFVLSVIGLLNTRNAVESQRVDQHKLNKARLMRGRSLLFEHHVLKIHTRQQRRVAAGEKINSNDHAAMRMHFCSGHWKVRRTGIFFWRPHVRGKGPGFIHKNYEVIS